jgi:hypothetical protein
LCGTAAAPGPTGTPTCPQSGTVARTVSAGDILNVNNPADGLSQGIAAGEMGRVVKAIGAGAAYGNVHSAMFPKGETRGQLAATGD